ncbi:DUF4232 domain-containing protein [Streptosporangium sandarakinum]|uniref:DUF4232 domain-containing protein n=1 Tax=Streptosporangium sandarakinum TaxID=1260955 RepID=A0A852UT63_9ACTN|nr:DUF4232 domain-containing protein [Streptosporangium sandarakinum]NYF38453.1 hypothetical protein [Streptosporangium sandarakinum]
MRRSNGAGSLPAFSMMVAGALMASAACGSATPVQRSISPAGNAAGDTRPASAVPAAGAAAALSDAAAPGRCRTGALSARVGRVDAGAGQRHAPLVLTNGSTRTCWVYGFPGLVTIDRNGDALRTRPRRENVRPQRVTLRPGASAHFRMHWTEVPSGRETTCPASARLMVIPPDETSYLTVPFSARVCDDGRIDLTPAAPGARL